MAESVKYCGVVQSCESPILFLIRFIFDFGKRMAYLLIWFNTKGSLPLYWPANGFSDGPLKLMEN